jgi:molybdopterin-binding protein
MRRIIATAAIVAFMATASMGLASANTQSHQGYWISGRVTAIQNGPQNSLVTMDLPNGQIFRFSSRNQKLEGVKIGDRISVRDVKGWAASIKNTNINLAKSSPNMQSHQGYWISGKVTAIQNGPQNSLVTMDLPSGQIFRFSSTNQKLGAIRIGDQIAVRDVNGWAAHINKTNNMNLAKSSHEPKPKT